MTIKQTLILIIITCVFSNPTSAQIESLDNIVGKNINIHSKILEEDREIQVYVPESYKTSNKEYPVLYVLDGQRFYLYAVSLHQSFLEFDIAPEFIIVGIKNKYPQRFSHFSTGASKFLDFIENDVISFIDKTYRTTNERMVFGWEFGGGFVIHAMTEKPSLFSGYISASPNPISKKGSRMKALGKLFDENKDLNTFLYFGISSQTPFKSYAEDSDNTDYLSELLTKKAPKSFRWKYQKLVGENHRSSSYGALYHGLRTYFSYYNTLVYNTVEEFEKSGGIPFMREYYSKRATKYGFPADVPDWTISTAISSAIDENNYVVFDNLINTFFTNEKLGKLRRSTPYHIAAFYQKHKKINRAIDIYNALLLNNPNSVRALNGLGDVYTDMNKKKKAATYYKKAEALSNKEKE